MQLAMQPSGPDPTLSNYPAIEQAGDVLPVVSCHPSYVFSPTFESRYNTARKVMDNALGSLINLNPPTLRVAAVQLGQLKLAELEDWQDFYKHGAVVSTMAVSTTTLLFHPDLVLYFANMLNVTADPAEITRRRKRMTTMIVHEAMHYVQGDTHACDPYRITFASEPAKINLIMSASNLVYDAIHDEGMADTIRQATSTGGADATLDQYLDQDMIRDHAGECREMLSEMLTQLECTDSEIADTLKMLKQLNTDKQTALSKTVTTMQGSAGWNQIQPPPTGGGFPDPNADPQDGDDQDDQQDSGTGGTSAPSPDSGPADPGKDPSNSPSSNGLSDDLNDKLNQNNHVVPDPLKPQPEPDPSDPNPAPRKSPQDQAREQIEEEAAQGESNRHKAQVMAGEDTGVFKLKPKMVKTEKQVDWRKVLQGAVRTAIKTGDVPSFRKHRQEEAMRGIYLPMKFSQEAHAACLMDTSGSVLWSGDMLGRFVYSVTGAIIAAGLNELTILPFDGGAHVPFVVNKSNMNRYRTGQIEIGGGGGTDLNPTLDEVLTFERSGKFPNLNKHSCLIVATDAEMQVPEPAKFRSIGMGSIIFIVPSNNYKLSGVDHWGQEFCKAVGKPEYGRACGATTRVIYIK